MRNNPVNFNDPSGHDADYFCSGSNDNSSRCTGYVQDQGTFGSSLGGGSDDGCENLDCELEGGNGGNSDEQVESAAYDAISGIDDPWARIAAYSTAWYYFSAWKFDAWLYRNLPSAFGFTISGSFGGSYFVGGVLDMSPMTYIFNWRSFELDRVSTADAGAILGIPPGPSGSLYSSVFAVKGASSNDNWFGKYASMAGGGYVGPGAIAGAAVGLNSWNIKDPHIDSTSRQSVWTFFVGGGLGSPQAGVSGTMGSTFFEEDIFDLDLPISPIPPNNPYLP